MLVAAAELVESSLYDGHPPAQRKLDRLQMVARLSHEPTDHGQQRLLAAARLMALVRADNRSEAHEALLDMESSWPHPLDPEIAIEIVLAFDAAVAEAYIAAGNSLEALRWATQMAEHVLETDDPRWHYRSSGLTATALAFNGDWDRANAQLQIGQSIVAKEQWDTDRADFMHAVAESQLAFMTLDAQRAATLAPRVRKLTLSEPSAKSLADIIEALALALGDHDSNATYLSLKIQQGITQPHGPVLIREFAKYLQAFLMLRQWDSLRALNSMRENFALGNHMLCPNVIRAAARLQLNDYSGVLAETNECVKIRARHSLYLYPFVLLCRSIAYFKLGNKKMAFRTATFLNKYVGTTYIAPALQIVPRDTFLELIDYLERHIPKAIFDFSQIRQLVPAPSAAAVDAATMNLRVRSFTEREKVIARCLRTPLTLLEIAQQLQLSPSTITSQASSIYRKLEVNGRDEAVQYLEHVGYFEF